MRKQIPLPMPDRAGEWTVTWMSASKKAMSEWTIDQANGIHYPPPKPPVVRVLVTETPGAGRMCRELRMGGSALVGFAPWSGEWRRA